MCRIIMLIIGSKSGLKFPYYSLHLIQVQQAKNKNKRINELLLVCIFV